MVDMIKIEDSEYCIKMMTTTLHEVNKLHIDDKLTDIRIRCGDTEIPVHKVIMAATAPLIRDFLLTTNENCGIITLKTIDEEAIKPIICFCYTGAINLEKCNAYKVFKGARHLKMESLKQLCENHIVDNINERTVVETTVQAKRLESQEIWQEAIEYLVSDFQELDKSGIFMDMDVDVLKEIFSREDLDVCSERVIFMCAINWINHDIKEREKHLLDLMKLVRLELLDKTFLMKITQNFHVCSHNAVFLNQIIEAMHFCNMSPQEAAQVPLEKIRNPRHGKGKVFVVKTDSNGTQSFVQLSADLKESKSLEAPKQHRKSFALALLKGNVYMIGGSTSFDAPFELQLGASNEVDVYSPATDTWLQVENMRQRRRHHCSCTHEGGIYVIGGVDDKNVIVKPNEVYFPEQGWNYIAKMNVSRKEAVATSFNGLVWVLGGCTRYNKADGYEAVNLAETYNPCDDMWTLLTKTMTVERSGHAVVPYTNKLLVFGGKNSDNKNGLVSCEKFDTEEGEFKEICQLSEPSLELSVVKNAGNIFLFSTGVGKNFQLFDPESYKFSNHEATISDPATIDMISVSKF